MTVLPTHLPAPARRRWSIAGVLAVVAASAFAGLASPVAVAVAEGPGAPPPWLGTTTSAYPSMTADGRFVVFEAYDPESEAGDVRAVLLRDLRRGVTTTLVRSTFEVQHYLAEISADGSRVAYVERRSGSEGNNGDLMVLDRRRGTVTDEGKVDLNTRPAVSRDGRFVAFERNEEDRSQNVYVRDVDRDVTTLVSVTPDGRPGNDSSALPSISADGRLVLFSSLATDLTPAVPTGGTLYLRDLARRTTTAFRVNDGPGLWAASLLSPDGRYALYGDFGGLARLDLATGTGVPVSAPDTEDRHSGGGVLSARGRVVAYTSSYQVGGELGDNYAPVLVKNLVTGREVVITAGAGGVEPWAYSTVRGITPGGRYVAFHSPATNLVPGDANGVTDVFVHDLRTGSTTLVSTR